MIYIPEDSTTIKCYLSTEKWGFSTKPRLYSTRFLKTCKSKDGYFNATSLLQQCSKLSQTKKEVKEFFENKGTKEFIEVLKLEEDLHRGNSPYVKSRASRGQNAGTWMHPIFLYRINCYYPELGLLIHLEYYGQISRE